MVEAGGTLAVACAPVPGVTVAEGALGGAGGVGGVWYPHLALFLTSKVYSSTFSVTFDIPLES